MATTGNNSDSSQKNTDNEDNGGKDDQNNTLECNICLENALDPVLSVCGHLYCWPCLHRWLETERNNNVCPVCKSGINKDKVIPIYGRGNSKQEDPRNTLPPRPAGQGTELNYSGLFGLNFGNGPMSFGIGAFPFRFLTSYDFNDLLHERNPVGSERDRQEDHHLSIIFSSIAVLFIFWLLLV